MNGCFHRGEIYHILPEDNETGSEQYSGRPAIIVSNEKRTTSSRPLWRLST